MNAPLASPVAVTLAPSGWSADCATFVVWYSRVTPAPAGSVPFGSALNENVARMPVTCDQSPVKLVLGVQAELGGLLAQVGSAFQAVEPGFDPTQTSAASNHGGFLGGEYGQQGDPDAFAAALHEALD